MAKSIPPPSINFPPDFDMSDARSALEVYEILQRFGIEPSDVDDVELWADGPLKAPSVASYLRGAPEGERARIAALLPYLGGRVDDELIEPEAYALLEGYAR